MYMDFKQRVVYREKVECIEMKQQVIYIEKRPSTILKTINPKSNKIFTRHNKNNIRILKNIKIIQRVRLIYSPPQLNTRLETHRTKPYRSIGLGATRLATATLHTTPTLKIDHGRFLCDQTKGYGIPHLDNESLKVDIQAWTQ